MTEDEDEHDEPVAEPLMQAYVAGGHQAQPEKECLGLMSGLSSSMDDVEVPVPELRYDPGKNLVLAGALCRGQRECDR